MRGNFFFQHPLHYIYIPDNFSNQITDAVEACRSSEISVDLIIIIVFL